MTNNYPKLDESPFMRLLNINRFSNRSLTVKDTDADHTIRMQLMLLEAYRCTEAFDIKEACFKALLHDCDEIASCDFPRQLKYYDDDIHREFQRVTTALLDQMELTDYLREVIENSKDDSIEGKLITFFDVIDAYRTLNLEAWKLHSRQLSADAQWSLDLILKLSDNFPYEPVKLKEYVTSLAIQCKESKIDVQ